MHRRPFIKQLGSSLTALPFLSNEIGLTNSKEKWQDWLNKFTTVCKIESVYTKLYFNELPAVPAVVTSGEFCKAQSVTYFYGNGKYCFQVFEKKHTKAGLLELMIPFWRRQANGSWLKVACISHFDLEALAEATNEFKEKSNQFLLPVQSSPSGGHISEKAHVQFVVHIQSNNEIINKIKVVENSGLVWQKTFNAHFPNYA